LALSLVLASACDRSPPAPPAAPVADARPPEPIAAAPSASVTTPDASPPSLPERPSQMENDLEPVIGDWHPESVDGVNGYAVDGTKWRDGTPSASLADQAKRLYGDRYAEFLDGVKSFAFFPLAVAKRDPPTGNARLSVRFYPLAGKIDQGAGIAFAIKEDGSYWGVRANALEDNILFFKVVKGKRTVLETIRSVPTPTRTWHTLTVELRGAKLEASLDGTKRLSRTLNATDATPLDGKARIGLWSKADSHVVFADFEALRL
jgi:hypothetical protein